MKTPTIILGIIIVIIIIAIAVFLIYSLTRVSGFELMDDQEVDGSTTVDGARIDMASQGDCKTNLKNTVLVIFN